MDDGQKDTINVDEMNVWAMEYDSLENRVHKQNIAGSRAEDIKQHFFC